MIPIVACTCDIADSKFAAVVTDAVPSAVTPAVTGRSFCPAEEMLSPTVFNFSPVAANFIGFPVTFFTESAAPPRVSLSSGQP